MLSSAQKQFAFNFREILIDEIALDGLDGTGLNLLWRRVEKRTSSPVTEKMCIRFWSFLVNSKDITFYQLPEPQKHFELLDRFDNVHEETGHVLEYPDPIDGPYEYNPREGEYGSCTYPNREPVSRNILKGMPYEEVVQTYGETLVMVASIEERWKALAPHMPITYLYTMTSIHYCILELVGRGRENGQMTIGSSNLTKIVKDSKLLFYNRNYLQNQGFIKAISMTQISKNKSVKSLLLRLKRFHKPLILSLPKKGLFYNVVQYLMTQPNNSELTDTMVRKGIFTYPQCKKFSKNFSNIFDIESKLVLEKSIYKTAQVQRKVMRLNPVSDESSSSDEETAEENVTSKYKVHMNLMRQAYEQFQEAGLRGLTQLEVAQLLGVEFYTSRAICRCFKAKKIVRELYEDKGKQRRARYIAVTAASSAFDAKYEEEKNKFLGYLEESINGKISKPSIVVESTESDAEVPKKKIKLDTAVAYDNVVDDTNITENEVTELSCFAELEEYKNQTLIGTKKNPTLRQLKYANGIIKIIREKLLISSYQTLSSLVAKEVNEPPMDSKSLKVFLQKLITHKQIKIFKMKWPGQLNRYSILLCAPHLQINDPIIKLKYKEANLMAIRNKTIKTTKAAPDPTIRSMSLYLNPRYMKIQKLHEFIIKLIYFNDDESYHSNLPKGFSSIVDMVPEFTVDFLIRNMSNMALAEISHINIPKDMMHLKLRNTPPEIFKAFLVSSTIQRSLTIYLKMLGMFGLIQLIKTSNQKNDSPLLSFVFYVNRRAKIIDTSGEWPREDEDIEALEKSYDFETFEDVERYWKDVYSISIRTKITLGQQERLRKHPLYEPRLKEEVEQNDDGRVLGNGLGPCGQDASFYMDVPRFWSAHYAQFLKKTTPIQKSVVNIKLPKIKTKRIRRVNKKKPVLKPVVEHKLANRKRKRETSSVPWSIEEDRIIILCKAAMTVMSPIAQPGCLRLRNLVAKQIISIGDPRKVASLCHKRSLSVELNSTLTYERDCVLNELKRHPKLVRNYENLFKVLRKQYTANLTKLINNAKLPMLELVWIMLQIVRSESFNQRVPCVALTLKEFHENFTMAPSYANKGYNMYTTPLEAGPTVAAIKEGMIFAVMTSSRLESTDVANIIYKMFNQYPEGLLRIAVDQLRKCGALAAKEKIMNNYMQNNTLHESMRAAYRISLFYYRKWCSVLNSGFPKKIAIALEEDLPQTDVKGGPEVNCTLLELLSCGRIELILLTVPVITGPANLMHDDISVIDLMMNFKLMSGAMGWRHKTNIARISEHYQDVQFENMLDVVGRNAKVENVVKNAAIEDRVVELLKWKKETGATFQELQDFTKYDVNTLVCKLRALESSSVIKRVGYYENFIVLTEFVKPWTISVQDQLITPVPWITPEMGVMRDVLVEWSALIMHKVFTYPGCSIAFLSDKCDYISARAVQEACIVLEKSKCVYLRCMKNTEPDFFSDDTEIPELEDYNEYESVRNIVVFPVKDALTRFSYMKSKLESDREVD